MKCAIIFPGQGSQYVGMGKSLIEKFPEAKEIFKQAGEVLGFDLAGIVLNGPEDKLKETQITQPAVFAVSAAAFLAFKETLPSSCGIACAAGHSLGEYSALFSGGVFDFKTGIKLIKHRGEFLQECCKKKPGSMAAILGMEREELKRNCEESSNGNGFCAMVNYNSPGQIVVAGTQSSVETLAKKVTALPGKKAILLNVSGAFHSSLMNDAAQKMKGLLQSVHMENARIPVVTNCDAQATTDAAMIKEKLVRQIDHPVLWEDSVRNMILNGVELFVEIGPGRVLSNLMKKIDKKKRVLNVEDEESLNKTLTELKNEA